MAGTRAERAARAGMDLKAFSGLAKAFGAAILAGGLALGGYEGVQARRAALWERDLATVGRKVEGADALAAREFAVLDRRAQSSQLALEALVGLEQPMEFLVGRKVGDLASRRQELEERDRRFIGKARKLSLGIAHAQDLRKGGKLSNAEFIGKARAAFGGEEPEAAWSGAPFGGAEGFASEDMADFGARVAAHRTEAVNRLAQAKSLLAELAPGFDEGRSQSLAGSWTEQAGVEASLAAMAEAKAQMDGYLAQVRGAADAAYRKEGESMSDDDWDEIKQGLERDPEWLAAGKGLVDAAAMSARAAKDQAGEAWGEERERARELAAAIARQPSAVDSLSVWEMAMLLHWMDEPGRVASAVAVAPQRLAAQGYSLTGAPKAGLVGSRAYQLAQGRSASVSPSYGPSGLVAALSRASSKSAVESKATGQSHALAEKADAARSAMGAGSGAVAARKGSASDKGMLYVQEGAPAAFAGLAAQRVERAASGQAASKAASGAANAAAGRAASSAASAAAGRAASSAASAASSRAASSAAASASSRASSSISSSGKR